MTVLNVITFSPECSKPSVQSLTAIVHHCFYIIGSDSSATDILVWSVPKLTLYEPNYKEKEIIKKSTDLHAEQIPGPKVHFLYCRTEMSHLKILKKLIQTKTNQKKITLSNLIEAEITRHLRRWEGGTVRCTFFVLFICQ